jgi:hypothetical protein
VPGLGSSDRAKLTSARRWSGSIRFWDELFPAERARIVRLLVERVDVGTDGVDNRPFPHVSELRVLSHGHTGSPIRRHGSQRQTLIGLGLNKIGRTACVLDEGGRGLFHLYHPVCIAIQGETNGELVSASLFHLFHPPPA